MPDAPSLRVPGTLATVLLGLEAASWLAGLRVPALTIVGELSVIAAIMVLRWWMGRAARTVAGRGNWPQRRLAGPGRAVTRAT